MTADADLLLDLMLVYCEPLSPRELHDILPRLMRGLSTDEIAEELVTERSTVKSQISNMLGKMGVTTRARAVYLALLLGLVALDPEDRANAVIALRERVEKRLRSS